MLWLRMDAMNYELEDSFESARKHLHSVRSSRTMISDPASPIFAVEEMEACKCYFRLPFCSQDCVFKESKDRNEIHSSLTSHLQQKQSTLIQLPSQTNYQSLISNFQPPTPIHQNAVHQVPHRRHLLRRHGQRRRHERNRDQRSRHGDTRRAVANFARNVLHDIVARSVDPEELFARVS